MVNAHVLVIMSLQKEDDDCVQNMLQGEEINSAAVHLY